MKILVISDIHDNFDNLVSILKETSERNIDQIICLWDLGNNGIAKIISYQWIPVHFIWWNNDWEIVNITKSFLESWHTVAPTVFDDTVIDDKKIFMVHYPNIAKSMAKSWDYDVILYGHDHKKHQEVIWNCLLLNPWEISAHKTWIASYAIYDTKTHKAEIFDLVNPSHSKHDDTSEYIKSLKFEFSNSKSHQL